MRLYSLTLLLVLGCSHNHPDPIPGGPTPSQSDAALGSGGGSSATELDFTFELPDAKIPIQAHVVVDGYGQTGRITIQEYPASVRVTPRVNLNVVGFSDLFQPGFCDN